MSNVISVECTFVPDVDFPSSAYAKTVNIEADKYAGFKLIYEGENDKKETVWQIEGSHYFLQEWTESILTHQGITTDEAVKFIVKTNSLDKHCGHVNGYIDNIDNPANFSKDLMRLLKSVEREKTLLQNTEKQSQEINEYDER